ncbi:hypothetical protein MicB006_3918 [Micromonospora sp. B006]|nr:hypothetical protein MicB006_3918 [Micromonospora sp. B006]
MPPLSPAPAPGSAALIKEFAGCPALPPDTNSLITGVGPAGGRD